MPDRPPSYPRRLFWLIAVLAFGAVGAGAAWAVPDEQTLAIDARLRQLDTDLREAGATGRTAADLIASTGLIPALAPAAKPGARPANSDPVVVARVNMRLALTMLAQSYGADDNGAVLAAQTNPALEALVIREGEVTLAGLRAALQDMQPVEASGPLTLRVPVVIWSGATLRLDAGDEVNLSRADGAFIVNFGWLRLHGAALRATGARNPASPSFSPFVTTADGGSLQVHGATFSGLGFGRTMKFSGLSVLGSLLRTAPAASVIEHSRFDSLQSVAVSTAPGLILRGNLFRDMRGAAVIVSNAPDAEISGNLFHGTMPTNAVRVEEGSVRSRISGNVILAGNRAGIVVRAGSGAAQVSHNIVWHREGGGIMLQKSDCGTVSDNIVISNAQKGIEIRSSAGTLVQGNAVLGNHSAGVWVSAQPKGAVTRVQGNILAANGSGLSSAGGEQIALEGNDFRRQFPRFLGGDLTLATDHVARDLQGAAPVVLTASGLLVGAGPDLAPVCARTRKDAG